MALAKVFVRLLFVGCSDEVGDRLRNLHGPEGTDIASATVAQWQAAQQMAKWHQRNPEYLACYFRPVVQLPGKAQHPCMSTPVQRKVSLPHHMGSFQPKPALLDGLQLARLKASK